MNYSVFRFTLNMHSHRSQASVAAFLGDTAIRLLINITDGGNAYIIEDGCTAVLNGTKADGKKLCNRCVILNNSTIQYDFTEQTTSWAGVVNCELTIYGKDGKEITAPKFIIVVDERELNSVELIESENERTALDYIFASEGARVEAEMARNIAENGEVDEEGNVISVGRVGTEKARDEAEKERSEAEKARAEAETGRDNAEKTRQEVEKERVEAEKARIDAETLRDSAEKARKEADDIRTAKFAELSALSEEIKNEVAEVEETLAEINEGGIEE